MTIVGSNETIQINSCKNGSDDNDNSHKGNIMCFKHLPLWGAEQGGLITVKCRSSYAILYNNIKFYLWTGMFLLFLQHKKWPLNFLITFSIFLLITANILFLYPKSISNPLSLISLGIGDGIPNGGGGVCVFGREGEGRAVGGGGSIQMLLQLGS